MTGSKGIKYSAITIGVLLVVSQFVRFSRTNPPVDPSRTIEARTQAPPQVARILERACRDCHSNQTVWPWYSNIAPVSWLVINDVDDGRGQMNFSDWTQYSAEGAARRLNRICDKLKSGDMPLWYYLPMHPNARLSAEDKAAVCAWTEAELGRLKTPAH